MGRTNIVRGYVLVLAIGFLLATVGSSSAQSPAPRALTDSEIHVPPNYFTMTPPPAGGTYVDPVFGTTIRRLTDATGSAGGNIVPEYSQTSSFNLDDSYLILGWPNGWHLYDGDGNLIDRLGDLVGGGEHEPRWSRTNPNWLYFHTSNQIRRYDVAANQVVDISPPFAGTIDFGGETGDVSDNERITVFRDQRYVSVWDLAAGVQVSAQELDLNQPPINGSPADYVTITKDGDSFVVGFVAQGTGRGQGSEQFDVDGNFIVQVLNTLGHAAMGRDVDGSQVLFVGNGNTNPPQPASCFPGILKITLDGSATRTCLVQVVWGVVEHFSAHGNDGWLYVSTYDPGALPVPAAPGDNNAVDDDDWHLYTNEIYRVRADGSVVERLAHHRSTAASFWLQPHANISISGNKLVYGSDFQLNGRAGFADTYLIDLTPDPPAAQGYYVLDRFGGVHQGGNAPQLLPATPYWGFDVAQDLELSSTGYQVLDRFGGVHPGGGAAELTPVVPYWGFDVARDLEMNAPGYYVLDGFGGIHTGGNAPTLSPTTPYFGFDVAQDLELASEGYFVLDQFGGVHPGGGAAVLLPATPYWGFSVAQDMEIAPVGYYVLDRFGGVHAGGGAPVLSPATPYWGFDVAQNLELVQDGYYVLDRFGGVHSGGGAAELLPAAPYWGFNVAQDLELR